MKNHAFTLSTSQLIDIAQNLQHKIEKGLEAEGREIKCLPTYIHPPKTAVKGQALVLDLGGTNFRAALITVDDKVSINQVVEANILEMKQEGFTREQLFEAQWAVIRQLKLPAAVPVGYCFSYPATSLLNGDAVLVNWTKGVKIDGMPGAAVGEPLLDFLNRQSNTRFSKIAVVNDTITSLFAGLSAPGYDAYIGLIVGTGTNMATFFPSASIPKLNMYAKWEGLTPVNLESGNFHPPHLTAFDETVDQASDNPGFQRFEKAVSGMYLGKVFKAYFSGIDFGEHFDAANLSRIMNQAQDHPAEQVEVAYQIYERSARLVAASVAGVVLAQLDVHQPVKRVQVLAEGSLFWSRIAPLQTSYAEIVQAGLRELLEAMDIPPFEVSVNSLKNANLMGAAISVLS
ncbi:MAG: hypothetical protein JXR22_02015 [Prolixibacteraceae bacterium]|nr:hypothetical protein [Prolixibacteraceae bacterium]